MRRATLTAAGIVIGILVLTGVMPLAGDAGLRQNPKPVRGRNVAVDQLRPGSLPKGVKLPVGEPKGARGLAGGKLPQEADGDAAPDPAVADALAVDDASAIVLDAGMDFNLVGAVGRRAGDKHEDAHVDIRTSLDGEVWSEWMTLTLESAPGDVSARRLVAEPCWVGEARYVQFVADAPVKDLELSFVNSLGETTLAERALDVVGKVATAVGRLWRSDVASATAGKPAIVSRSAWGADESLRRTDPETAPVKMTFIHHTAGGNSYSRSQAPAVVRAVYYYHVKGAGFNDLGYNFLIDRYGTIYEGRYGGIGEGVVGAHTLGFNTGSTGVALMGTFTSSSPPSAALTSLKKLLAWKLDVHHVDPTGSARMTCRASEKFDAGRAVNFAAISGHRNANFTACPGNALYGRLPSVRTAVAKRGLPKIYAPTVSPTLFSPDGDGRADTTKVRFSASETVDWRLEIRGQDGDLVRRFSGSGRTVSRTWNGRDGSGATVPDGTYAVKVTASSARGSARAARLAVTVDTEPPRIEGVSVDPLEIGRRDDSRRETTRVAYTVSEEVQTRVTIRNADDSRARTVSDWRWIPVGSRSVAWNGTVEFVGSRIPAPDGPYTILVEARDRAGTRVANRTEVRCESDPVHWSDGSTFCTKATRNFAVRRGRRALFRFKILYAPASGEAVPFETAKVTFKIRDADGRSRYTRQFNRGVNAQRSYTIRRCWLPRGSYRYYIYATLPDGRTQQMVGSARFRLR